MILSRQHLVPLLNALYRSGTTQLTVSHPSDTVGDLLDIRLGAPTESTVRFPQDRETYRETRDQVYTNHGEQAYDDLPDAGSFVRALTAAGLVPLANEDALCTYIERYGYRDLDAGHAPVVLGIDANIAPWELPTVLDIDHRTGQTDDAGRRATNGYALATGVKEELNWYYKHFDTYSLETAFGPEFDRLTNQPAGANREGFLGLYTYRRLVATRNVDEIETETGDNHIIAGYAEYAEDSRKTPLLVSNDREFIENAREAGLLAHHVSFTPVLPRTVSATWDEIADALYFLGVLFGVLTLPKVTLYGAWNGKSGHHWQDETVSLEFRSPKLEPLVARQTQIIDAYEDVESA